MWSAECVGCGRPGRRVCRSCAGTGPLARWPGTEIVGGIRAAGSYDGELGDIVRRVKGSGDRGLALALARRWATRVSQDPDSLAVLHAADAITWAPSPWTRRARRGFSLGAVLAIELGTLTSTPVVSSLRAGPGPRQARQSRRDRRANLRGRIRATTAVQGRLILVDDVVTTGATIDACARELLGGGASAVEVFAICRVGDVAVSRSGHEPTRVVRIL